VIPHPSVSYVSPGATGTLTVAPLPDAFGVATITVTVSDGQSVNGSTQRTFTVTVNPVNDPPTLDPITNRVVQGGGLRTVPLTGLSGGPTNEAQVLQVTAVSSNTALVPHPTVRYTSPNPTGTLEFTPVSGATGTVTLVVTVNDGAPSNHLVVRAFTVTVLEPPAEPRLRIGLEPDGRVAVFWPAALTTFALESKDAFGPENLWAPVAGSPQRVGQEFKLTLPPNGASRFYRLAPLAPSLSPRLRWLRLEQGQLALAWPTEAGVGVLEAREAFRPDSPWAVVTATPQVEGNEFRVRLTPDGQGKFFRWRP
jgi:hypothetical protein